LKLGRLELWKSIAGLPDDIFFVPKIPVWLNLGGFGNGRFQFHN
jgi:hypothetical protein